MANELKIRIKRDSKGNELSLGSITIEAVESLKTFLDSFIALAKLYDNPEEFRVSLTEGSVESNFIAPADRKEFSQDIKGIIDGNLEDVEKIKAFRSIQNKIKLNGLEYEVYWKINNKTNNLTHVFKGSSFPFKRNKLESKSEIVFVSGELFDAGGKTVSNIHMQLGSEEVTIGCSREEVLKINKFMYKTIFISAVKTLKENHKPCYKLVDCYVNLKQQLEVEEFYNSILGDESLNKHDIIYNKLIESLENEDVVCIENVMRIFDNSFTERGIIRTILMTMKPYINNKELGHLRGYFESLSKTLRIGSLNNRI